METPQPRCNPPLSKIIREGTVGSCPLCHSTENKNFWGKVIGCINPLCERYYIKLKNKNNKMKNTLKLIDAFKKAVDEVTDINSIYINDDFTRIRIEDNFHQEITLYQEILLYPCWFNSYILNFDGIIKEKINHSTSKTLITYAKNKHEYLSVEKLNNFLSNGNNKTN